MQEMQGEQVEWKLYEEQEAEGWPPFVLQAMHGEGYRSLQSEEQEEGARHHIRRPQIKEEADREAMFMQRSMVRRRGGAKGQVRMHAGVRMYELRKHVGIGA